MFQQCVLIPAKEMIGNLVSYLCASLAYLLSTCRDCSMNWWETSCALKNLCCRCHPSLMLQIIATYDKEYIGSINTGIRVQCKDTQCCQTSTFLNHVATLLPGFMDLADHRSLLSIDASKMWIAPSFFQFPRMSFKQAIFWLWCIYAFHPSLRQG